MFSRGNGAIFGKYIIAKMAIRASVGKAAESGIFRGVIAEFVMNLTHFYLFAVIRSESKYASLYVLAILVSIWYVKTVDQKNTANRPFPATRWSLIAEVADLDPEKKAKALDELCRVYWSPVYAFIRSKGASRAEAEDLTQGFFLSFLARDDFAKASRECGKLRTYMLRSVQNFMHNDWRSRQCLKRGGGIEVISIDIEYEDGHGKFIEPTEKDTPESIFDRQWAITVLHNVLEALEQRYEKRGQGSLFQALRHVISTGEPGTSYAEVAEAEGMTESAVKVAAYRLRNRYASLLKETIADTLLEGEETGKELQELMAAFG